MTRSALPRTFAHRHLYSCRLSGLMRHKAAPCTYAVARRRWLSCGAVTHSRYRRVRDNRG
eukprot:6104502-Ditylum_brightwellii.AAC.1